MFSVLARTPGRFQYGPPDPFDLGAFAPQDPDHARLTWIQSFLPARTEGGYPSLLR